MNALAFQTPAKLFSDYSSRLSAALQGFDWTPVERLAYDLRDCWQSGRQVFLCGNGGSGGNANHLANDLLYALSKTKGSGLRVHSLSANPSTLTCLANDEGYDQVFSLQLAVLARAGDVLDRFFRLRQLAEHRQGAGGSKGDRHDQLCGARLFRRQGQGACRRAHPFRDR